MAFDTNYFSFCLSSPGANPDHRGQIKGFKEKKKKNEILCIHIGPHMPIGPKEAKNVNLIARFNVFFFFN